MDRSRLFGALALVAALSPAVALADVPGGPPAVPPDCPAGTRLEGPYRYWRCVPDAPALHDQAADVTDAPAPPVEPTPPAVQPAPPPAPADPPAPPPASSPRAEGWHTTAGCTVAPGTRSGSLALVLFAALAFQIARRRRID